MTAAHPKLSKSAPTSKVYRAKVTGRHAITLPAELCRELGIEVGDSVELQIKDGIAELRSTPVVPVLSLAELQGILRPFFKDWEDIQQHIKELRDEWDDHPELDEMPVDEQTTA